KLGEEVRLAPDELRSAGRYTAIVNNTSGAFFVEPAAPAALNFLARPSRVPVARPNVVSGVAFVFDDYRNLVLAPTEVKFSLQVADAPAISRSVPARMG